MSGGPRPVLPEDRRFDNKSTYWMIFELIWSDFFTFIGWKHGDRLFHQSGPMQKDIDWVGDDEVFRRWATGTTGIPFVDANMRELNRTGYMSNRGRQNVASFLADALQVDWRMGAAYFESKLLDYDVASNWGNWVYQAGVGNDSRDGYFYVPGQAERYDPKGKYVKHWLPELNDLPANEIHEPFRQTPKHLADKGDKLSDELDEELLAALDRRLDRRLGVRTRP